MFHHRPCYVVVIFQCEQAAEEPGGDRHALRTWCVTLADIKRGCQWEMIKSLTFMSGNMGGFQHAVPLPQTKHSQHNTEITAVIEYFGDNETIIRKLDASAQPGEESWSSVNVKHTGRKENHKETTRSHSARLSRRDVWGWIHLSLNSLMTPRLTRVAPSEKDYFVFDYCHNTWSYRRAGSADFKSLCNRDRD